MAVSVVMYLVMFLNVAEFSHIYNKYNSLLCDYFFNDCCNGDYNVNIDVENVSK
jgi:hypothetical protein